MYELIVYLMQDPYVLMTDLTKAECAKEAVVAAQLLHTYIECVPL